MNHYDIIVIGAGHAGVEAALAASRMGCSTLLVVLKLSTIGLMSCNPAIGGVGKGQLVREIDALGGQMGKAADACGIQFRILNASKGPAVQSLRAQIDRECYRRYIHEVVSKQGNLFVKEAQVTKILVKDGQVKGVLIETGEEIYASAVVVCPGTFLNGLIHIGLNNFPGGRIDEPAANSLALNLKEIGLGLLRFKTGTCPRLDKNSIDYSKLIRQDGDALPLPFSFSTHKIDLKQIPCYITYTNKRTHQIIQDNLNKSPLYSGVIKATGVRYCPSIEDKIIKFADKERHQVFLEPDGLDTDQVYPNGLSTSLPEDVQLKMLRSIEGLEQVRVIRFGYAIEHMVVEPTQLLPTLETKLVNNLYLAGQINGTTGYEEAAAQGLVAGINAALKILKKEPLILGRDTSYIGVLIDDLTTKGTSEPYRMFTSRVEYRLILRQDNADLRLKKFGYACGLITDLEYKDLQKKQEAIKEGISFIRKTLVKPSQGLNAQLSRLNTSSARKVVSLEEFLRRPQISMKDLIGIYEATAGLENNSLLSGLSKDACRQIEIEVKYAGFIERQLSEVRKFQNLEKIKIPVTLDYAKISGLSREIKEKLIRLRPLNLGQASRVSGVTPASISLLMVYLRKINSRK